MDQSTFEDWKSDLEALWRSPDGPLFQLRQGLLDDGGLDRAIQVLRSIDLTDADCLPRRLVELLWYMPTFMEWQLERVIEAGGDRESLRTRAMLARDELERILGVP